MGVRTALGDARAWCVAFDLAEAARAPSRPAAVEWAGSMRRPRRPDPVSLRVLLGPWALLTILSVPRTAASAGPVPIVFSGSAVGAEGEVFARQITAFEARNPGWKVTRHPTPDDADQRHHLYVQWLNAGARQPDVLQLDVVWTPEFAAAGWIRPLDGLEDEAADFFPHVLQADRLDGRLYAMPLFVDVGMLYYRRDLVEAPGSLDELRDRGLAMVRAGRTRYGFVWQGARYEGLITVFIEHLAAFGGQVLDEQGRVRVDDLLRCARSPSCAIR